MPICPRSLADVESDVTAFLTGEDQDASEARPDELAVPDLPLPGSADAPSRER